MPKSTKAKTTGKKEKKPLPLNKAKREELIQYWRSKGWSYDQITAKFEAGVTEAEYEEAKKQWEA